MLGSSPTELTSRGQISMTASLLQYPSVLPFFPWVAVAPAQTVFAPSPRHPIQTQAQGAESSLAAITGLAACRPATSGMNSYSAQTRSFGAKRRAHSNASRRWPGTSLARSTVSIVFTGPQPAALLAIARSDQCTCATLAARGAMPTTVLST